MALALLVDPAAPVFNHVRAEPATPRSIGSVVHDIVKLGVQHVMIICKGGCRQTSSSSSAIPPRLRRCDVAQSVTRLGARAPLAWHLHGPDAQEDRQNISLRVHSLRVHHLLLSLCEVSGDDRHSWAPRHHSRAAANWDSSCLRSKSIGASLRYATHRALAWGPSVMQGALDDAQLNAVRAPMH